MGRVRLNRRRRIPRRLRSLRIGAPRTAAAQRACLELRWRLLRAPWGRPRGSERDAFERAAVQIAAWVAPGAPVAVGRVHRVGTAEARIRYMCVEPQWRGLGVGAALLAVLERRARAGGARRIVLDARAGAVRFYARHGYRDAGPGRTLFGTIRHRRMVKTL